METFLGKIARDIANRYPQEADQVLVVFNNRRSLRFFKRQFESMGSTMFLPQTMVIDELVGQLGGLEIVPREFLIFELFKIHTDIIKGTKYTSFEEFISFGDLMLADFSEIDQYCVDAHDLFNNLHALKSLGEWDVEGSGLTQFQVDYLTFYRSLYDYYRLLHERLAAQGKAYSGMAYRHVAENIEALAGGCRYKEVYFIGFDALSECERRIIGEYVRAHNGHLLADGDPYYFDERQEAGYFLRKHCEEFPDIRPSGESLYGQGEHHICVVECPDRLLQCKYAGAMLEAMKNEDERDLSAGKKGLLDNTAVVLADESLLMPMLNSLPEGIDVNISMGYGFADTGMNMFAKKLLSLHRRRNESGYYHEDILDVMSDQLAADILGGENMMHGTARYFEKNNIIRCKTQDLAQCVDSEHLAEIFPEEVLDVDGWIAMMMHVAETLGNGVLKEKSTAERQAAASLTEILVFMADMQAEYHYIDNFKTLEKVYVRLAQKHTVDLVGEPLSGLQILGMLEARNLDFRRVILLSANEGVLPAGRSGNTLIPHDLKNEFHLPTYREKDCVYANHFYRLLQRADTAYLMYATENELMGKGEKSRFITQVEDELAPAFGIHVEHRIMNNDGIPRPAPAAVPTAKSGAMMESIRRKAAEGFSPTSFEDYICCPQEYYYKHILGVKENDSLEDDIDSSQLGECIHNSLEEIYGPYVGHTVDPTGLRSALAGLPDIIDRQFRELFKNGRSSDGRNHFYRSVVEAQLRNLLRKEISITENNDLCIEMLENELGPMVVGHDPLGNPYCLKGRVDRVDRLNGQLRVIDYKSGSLDGKEIAYTDPDGGFSIENKLPGKWFQLMCYALLYNRVHGNNEENVVSAIYPLRYTQKGLQYATWNGSELLGLADLERFRAMLDAYCLELLSPDSAFRVSDDKQVCRFCPVHAFCLQHP